MFRFSLFMGSMIMAFSGAAGATSQCSADTVPIQIVNGTNNHPVTTLSAARMSDSNPHFRAFVTAVTEHVAARLAKDKLCIDSTNSKERSLLQFENWRVITSDDKSLASIPSPDVQPSGGCRISSPWIDLAFERGPVPWVRGVVRWNQRQLLADQAMLAGAHNVPAGMAIPLKQSEFVHFALDYAETEILREPATKPVEERIPPDLLWLFRGAWQSTNAPFVGAATRSMEKAMEEGAGGYTKLVIALIDRCFASDGANIQYGSILEVSDLIQLEQYKINTPIR